MKSVREICQDCKKASYELAVATSEQKNEILLSIAQEILSKEQEILKANAIDLENASHLSSAMQDRLTLNHARINAMAEGVRQVAQLQDPIGEVVDSWTRPNGLQISKVRAPLGVIAVIYESRPNVTIDVASLCIKSGNCVVLRGGKEAINSNRALFEIIQNSISKIGYNSDIVGFVDDPSREGSKILLQQEGLVDVVIPRGGDGLKKFVLENAIMPVIASAGGNCHVYVEKTADLNIAMDIVYNAKMSRPSTCNALEQLLVDKEIAKEFLPKITQLLLANGCVVNGSLLANSFCKDIVVCDNDEFKKEHADYILTIFVVDNYVEAIDRINTNGTKHSEAIVSKDTKIIDIFTKKVDSACVYANASTRFTDGFEFGFGAEIGISTQKLHARGPLGLRQLTSEKYTILGQGQTRK